MRSASGRRAFDEGAASLLDSGHDVSGAAPEDLAAVATPQRVRSSRELRSQRSAVHPGFLELDGERFSSRGSLEDPYVAGFVGVAGWSHPHVTPRSELGELLTAMMAALEDRRLAEVPELVGQPLAELDRVGLRIIGVDWFGRSWSVHGDDAWTRRGRSWAGRRVRDRSEARLGCRLGCRLGMTTCDQPRQDRESQQGSTGLRRHEPTSSPPGWACTPGHHLTPRGPRCPRRDHREQLVGFDRLRDVVVEAGHQRAGAVFRARVGGDRHRRQAATVFARPGADLRDQRVLLRHADVRQQTRSSNRRRHPLADAAVRTRAPQRSNTAPSMSRVSGSSSTTMMSISIRGSRENETHDSPQSRRPSQEDTQEELYAPMLVLHSSISRTRGSRSATLRPRSRRVASRSSRPSAQRGSSTPRRTTRWRTRSARGSTTAATSWAARDRTSTAELRGVPLPRSAHRQRVADLARPQPAPCRRALAGPL